MSKREHNDNLGENRS